MSGSDRRWWVPVLAATSVAAVGLAIAIPRFQGDSESQGARGEPSRLYGEYQKIGLDLVDLHPDVRPVR